MNLCFSTFEDCKFYKLTFNDLPNKLFSVVAGSAAAASCRIKMKVQCLSLDYGLNLES